jgi:hypothetical protein
MKRNTSFGYKDEHLAYLERRRLIADPSFVTLKRPAGSDFPEKTMMTKTKGVRQFAGVSAIYMCSRSVFAMGFGIGVFTGNVLSFECGLKFTRFGEIGRLRCCSFNCSGVNCVTSWRPRII